MARRNYLRQLSIIEEDDWIRRVHRQERQRARDLSEVTIEELRRLRSSGEDLATPLRKFFQGLAQGAALSTASTVGFADWEGSDDDKFAAALWSSIPMVGMTSYYLATGQLPIPTDRKGLYYMLLMTAAWGTIENLVYLSMFGPRWIAASWTTRVFAKPWVRSAVIGTTRAGTVFVVISRGMWLLTGILIVDTVYHHETGQHLTTPLTGILSTSAEGYQMAAVDLTTARFSGWSLPSIGTPGEIEGPL